MEQKYLEQIQMNQQLKELVFKKNLNDPNNLVDPENLLLKQQIGNLEEKLEESHR